jgi:hypothetical protein
MYKAWVALAIAGMMLAWSPSASATVLFDNGGPIYFLPGFASDTANKPTGPYGPISTATYKVYDDFTLSSPATITGMEWWGFYSWLNSPPATDSFSYDIQSGPAGGGAPSGEVTNGSLGSGNRTDTGHEFFVGYIGPYGFSSLPYEVYEYSDSSLDIPLPAGNYELSIYDTATNPGNTFDWEASSTTEPLPDAWTIGSDGSSYALSANGNGFDMAFNLTGIGAPAPSLVGIPEPATMTLLGLGLAGLIGRQMRRRNGR